MSLFPNKILALDLSSPVSSISLHVHEESGFRLLGEKTLTERNSHSELLLTSLGDLLTKNSWSLDDVEGFVTCRGPGSFTGLRIGYATLLGFVAVKPRPIYSISGAEARRCGYLAKVKKEVPIRVVTKIATGRFVESDFDKSGKLVSESEKTAHSPTTDGLVILLDGMVDTAGLTKENSVQYPLSSRDLVTALTQSKALGTHLPASGYRDFTPSYFGSTKFD